MPPRSTSSLPQSTPIKADSSMTLPFTTTQKYCVESCTAMADKMKKYIVGPMPAQKFLDKFFPVNDIPLFHRALSRNFVRGCYEKTLKAAKEEDMYEPFVSLKEFPLYISSQVLLLLRSRHPRNSVIPSNLSIHIYSSTVIHGQDSHSKSNLTSLSTHPELIKM